MSPYCPSCLGVSLEGEVRCPLDQQFLFRRNCSDCGSELFPREIYCANCGAICRAPKETLLIPPEASLRQLVASMMLDYFTFSMVVVSVLLVPFGDWVFPIALILSFLYRALGRSDGRQTFGQSVFHVLSIGSDAGPSTFSASLRRGLWEFILLPKSLWDPLALSSLERRTSTLEVSLV